MANASTRSSKPPIGIVPPQYHDGTVRERYDNLVAAIQRRLTHGFPIPVEWTVEFNDLIVRLDEVGMLDDLPEVGDSL